MTMNPADKERLLARIADNPLFPHERTLCAYRTYLNEVTDVFTFGGLVLDVCGTGWWICVPGDNKMPRYSKKGVWAYQRGEDEMNSGLLRLVERRLGLDKLHGGYDTLFLTDWDIARRYVEQL